MSMRRSLHWAAALALTVASGAACCQDSDALRGEKLSFTERPAWQERLDRIGRHGLRFVRLRENRDSKLVFGMHPKGYVGVFLQPRSSTAL
jgi:hypothetical protein